MVFKLGSLGTGLGQLSEQALGSYHLVLIVFASWWSCDHEVTGIVFLLPSLAFGGVLVECPEFPSGLWPRVGAASLGRKGLPSPTSPFRLPWDLLQPGVD